METLQSRVWPWMLACFGEEVSRDKEERGDRLLEEVFELLQSGGYDPARVLALRDYVWSREIGEPAQEVGGVMITLAAYCLAHDLNMHEAGEVELARIWTKVEKIRAKQAAKPKGSALPQAWPADLAPDAAPVRVKALVWEAPADKSANEYQIEHMTACRTYKVVEWCDGSGHVLWFGQAGKPIRIEAPDTAVGGNVLKAAAQAHHTSRILAALETPAHALMAELVEALRDTVAALHNAEKTLTEELYRQDFCGESSVLCDARAVLAKVGGKANG